jgi:hypothetical protein
MLSVTFINVMQRVVTLGVNMVSATIFFLMLRFFMPSVVSPGVVILSVAFFIFILSIAFWYGTCHYADCRGVLMGYQRVCY